MKNQNNSKTNNNKFENRQYAVVFFLFIANCLLSTLSFAQTLTFDPIMVTTFAGDSTGGFADGIGAAAKFNAPTGVATDASGNVFVADALNNRIRKITPAGVVTTLAGDSAGGFADGTGAAAKFNVPTGVATDASGNVFVADRSNHRIRKITTAGVVTTLAGNGVAGFADGTGTAAKFSGPTGVSVDASGNVFVADAGNNRIRKITAAGVVTTLAGSGTAGFANGTGATAQFNNPYDVSVDALGNIFVADISNHCIRKITPVGVVTTLAGSDTVGFADGTGTAAKFNNPCGVSVDALGNVFVTDYNNHLIRKITAAGVVTTLAGAGYCGDKDGIGTMAEFCWPFGASVDALGNVFVADASNYRIRKMTTPVLNIFSTVQCTASVAQLFNVSGVNLAANLTVGAPTGYEVSLSDINGSVYAGSLSITPSGGSVASTLIYIRLSAATPVGTYNNNIALSSTGASTKYMAVTGTVTPLPPPSIIFDPPPTLVTTLAGGVTGYADGTGTAAKFNYPNGVSLDTSGNVFVADNFNNRIRKITDAGVVTTLAGNGAAGFADGTGATVKFNAPTGVSVDASGNVFVADRSNHRIRKITAAGVVTTLAGNGVAGFADGTGGAAKFSGPTGVSVDASGNVFVADAGNNRIRKITAAGVVTTFAGSGVAGFANGTGAAAQFYDPRGVSVDNFGNIFIADKTNHRIRKITAAGVVTTFAGSGAAGFADGTGAAAMFNAPTGVSVNAAGNVFVADANNQRIRKITDAGVVTTHAGNGIAGFADGSAASAQFNNPQGVSADVLENVFVADLYNNRIRKTRLVVLTSFSTTQGTASMSQSFYISGINLTVNLTVTAPAGYEVSLNGSSGYAATLNLAPSCGLVPSTLIYIRLSAATLAGTYNDNISISATGAVTKYLAVAGVVTTGSSINPPATNGFEEKVEVTPNPNSGIFDLHFKLHYLQLKNLQVKIYNVLGEIVYPSFVPDNYQDHLPLGNALMTIDLSSQPAGIYNVQIITDIGIANKKVIIQ